MLCPRSRVTVVTNGKRYRLPKLMSIGDKLGSSKYTWKLLGYRKPSKGEYYVSGSRPALYKAPDDLGMEYLVVELQQEYKPAQAYTLVKHQQHWSRKPGNR